MIAWILCGLLTSTVCADTYIGTDSLPGWVTASPIQGSGGDTFRLSVDFQLSMTVDIDPFQSLTFTEVTFEAIPAALDFPGFNGNITLTIEDLSFEWIDLGPFDLNPATGGVFETPQIFGQDGGTVDLTGQWDNFGFHADLSSIQTVGQWGGFITREIIVDPVPFPDVLSVGFTFYNQRDNDDLIANRPIHPTRRVLPAKSVRGREDGKPESYLSVAPMPTAPRVTLAR